MYTYIGEKRRDSQPDPEQISLSVRFRRYTAKSRSSTHLIVIQGVDTHTSLFDRNGILLLLTHFFLRHPVVVIGCGVGVTVETSCIDLTSTPVVVGSLASVNLGVDPVKNSVE